MRSLCTKWRLLQLDMLALDEVRLQAVSAEMAQKLHGLISDRYERRPRLLMSNRGNADSRYIPAFGGSAACCPRGSDMTPLRAQFDLVRCQIG